MLLCLTPNSSSMPEYNASCCSFPYNMILKRVLQATTHGLLHSDIWHLVPWPTHTVTGGDAEPHALQHLIDLGELSSNSSKLHSGSSNGSQRAGTRQHGQVEPPQQVPSTNATAFSITASKAEDRKQQPQQQLHSQSNVSLSQQYNASASIAQIIHVNYMAGPQQLLSDALKPLAHFRKEWWTSCKVRAAFI